MGVWVLLLLLLQLLQPSMSEGTVNTRTVGMRRVTDAHSWSSSTHPCMSNRRSGTRDHRPPPSSQTPTTTPPPPPPAEQHLLLLLLLVMVVAATGFGDGGGGGVVVGV